MEILSKNNKKLKIVILANQDSILYATKYELILKLSEAGFDVVLSVPAGGYVPQFMAAGCRVVDTPVDRRGVNPIKDWQLLRFYRTLLKREQPDLVLTFTIKPNIYGGWVARTLGISCIATITGLGTAVENRGPLRSLALFLYRHGLSRDVRVFFQNDANRETLQRCCATRKEQVIMVPGSGVNLTHFSFVPFPENNATTRLLWVARLMKDKGIEEFLTAIDQIGTEHTDVVFDILGEYEERYEETVLRLMREGKIIYHGFQKDVRPFLARCSAIVLPSYHEGTANVLLEAAATGRPILASRVSGCSETFIEGKSGLGFAPRSTEALLNVLREFLSLPIETRRTMGLTGRKLMESRFDRNQVTNIYYDTICDVLDCKNT